MPSFNVEQRTPQWQAMRLGRIKGTSNEKIMGTKKAREDYKYEFVAEMLTVPDLNAPEYENAMQRGTRLEEKALAAYEFEYGCKVETVGFIVSDVDNRLAYSPDGITNEGTRGIDFKCPLGKNFMKAVLLDEHEYIDQIVHAFICNPKLVDFDLFFYNPEIPSIMSHTIRYTREQLSERIEKNIEEQTSFLLECREMLSKLIK